MATLIDRSPGQRIEVRITRRTPIQNEWCLPTGLVDRGWSEAGSNQAEMHRS